MYNKHEVQMANSFLGWWGYIQVCYIYVYIQARQKEREAACKYLHDGIRGGLCEWVDKGL